MLERIKSSKIMLNAVICTWILTEISLQLVAVSSFSPHFTDSRSLAFNRKLSLKKKSKSLHIHNASIRTENESSSKSSSSSSLSFQLDVDLPESQYTQVLTSPTLPVAKQLRETYDKLFADPRQPNAKRFIFDPWLVTCGEGTNGNPAPLPGDEEVDIGEGEGERPTAGEREATSQQVQYSLKRTQCSNLFSADQFENLAEELTDLGRSIGLSAITPPWISLYMNGDMQNFHTDAPHGPMAFVLSLCGEDSSFQGGETMLLRRDILDYWRGFDGSKGLEAPSIVRYIPPTPGRCIAFDPRVPHGVNQVVGSNDPRKGRVVIHGWFSEPEVCWFGPWEGIDHNDHKDDDNEHEANRILDRALQPLVTTLGSGEIGRVMGYLAVRLDIGTEGEIMDATAVCDTLQADMEDFRGVIGYDEADRPVMEDAAADVRLTVFESLKNLYFEDGKEGRAVVVPFSFE